MMRLWNEEERLFIPNDKLEQFDKSLVGEPILAPTQQIENITEFLEKRYNILDSYFEDDNHIYKFSTDKSVLKKYVESETPFIFLSIDMVKSTKMSLELHLNLNSIINNLFLNEIAKIIREMGGHIYKFEGDGLISFLNQIIY